MVGGLLLVFYTTEGPLASPGSAPCCMYVQLSGRRSVAPSSANQAPRVPSKTSRSTAGRASTGPRIVRVTVEEGHVLSGFGLGGCPYPDGQRTIGRGSSIRRG